MIAAESTTTMSTWDACVCRKCFCVGLRARLLAHGSLANPPTHAASSRFLISSANLLSAGLTSWSLPALCRDRTQDEITREVEARAQEDEEDTVFKEDVVAEEERAKTRRATRMQERKGVLLQVG